MCRDDLSRILPRSLTRRWIYRSVWWVKESLAVPGGRDSARRGKTNRNRWIANELFFRDKIAILLDFECEWRG